jgi:lipopolysaccharide export LptBFGC system permease protein LptF
MSRTLFWYIFKDLFKIFMMTSGALAGIMSFGGLLRPLMQGGLDLGQVAKMLGYLSPAMSAYSFPIAALFATSVVYGRLSADNEITGARAGGISFFWMSMPALVLGLVVSIISLLFLCFVVPNFTLKVEKVIYSNVAQLIASKFERNHQMKFDKVTVYAQEAHVLPPTNSAKVAALFRKHDDDSGGAGDGEAAPATSSPPPTPSNVPVLVQHLQLIGPMIVNYKDGPEDKKLKIPTDFFAARSADVYIRQDPKSDRIQVAFSLDEGLRVPRDLAGSEIGGVAAVQFGPIERESMIRENTKFMVLRDLKRKFESPWRSERIARMLAGFVSEDQQAKMAELVQRDLASTARTTLAGKTEAYEITAAPGTVVTNKGTELVLASPEGGPATITVKQTAGAPEPLSVTCARLRIRSTPVDDGDLIVLDLRMTDATVTVGGDTLPPRGVFPRSVAVPMPAQVKRIESYRTNPGRYASTGPEGTANQRALGRALLVLQHDITSEIHSRLAFALSCFVLVIVGCVMGMIFKSGNFLAAFAVSFVPALAVITLIIAGQRTCENVPTNFWKVGNSLQLGLGLIWSGVVTVGALGGAMLWRLQRT